MNCKLFLDPLFLDPLFPDPLIGLLARAASIYVVIAELCREASVHSVARAALQLPI
jgi:hypothetical protein